MIIFRQARGININIRLFLLVHWWSNT